MISELIEQQSYIYGVFFNWLKRNMDLYAMATELSYVVFNYLNWNNSSLSRIGVELVELQYGSM